MTRILRSWKTWALVKVATVVPIRCNLRLLMLLLSLRKKQWSSFAGSSIPSKIRCSSLFAIIIEHVSFNYFLTVNYRCWNKYQRKGAWNCFTSSLLHGLSFSGVCPLFLSLSLPRPLPNYWSCVLLLDKKQTSKPWKLFHTWLCFGSSTWHNSVTCIDRNLALEKHARRLPTC